MSLEIKVWRTIELGNGIKDGLGFVSALCGTSSNIYPSAMEFFERRSILQVSPGWSDVKLVNVSVEELGFAQGATYQEICDRAEELGFKLCVPAVAPQLRLQYPDQPKDSELYVATKPIRGKSFGLYIFALYGGGSQRRSIGVVPGDAGVVHGSNIRFVFLAPGESLVAISRPVRYPVLLMLAAVLLSGILAGVLLGNFIRLF